MESHEYHCEILLQLKSVSPPSDIGNSIISIEHKSNNLEKHDTKEKWEKWFQNMNQTIIRGQHQAH